MNIECELVFEYESKEQAEKVLRSVELDNEGFVEANVVDNRIVSRIKAKNIASLRHTLDDYLACIAVAEKVISSP
jgi:tRNA threonylcarbamoyladenosine modification (KEOPS) complex  Pcc1 subunit